MPNFSPRFLHNLESVADRTAVATITTFALDAASKRMAAVFRPLPGRVMTDVGVYCSAVSGVPPSYEVRLESVAGGNPTGNLLEPTSKGVVTPTAAAWRWVALEQPVVASDSGPIAAIVTYSAGTIGPSNSATFNYRLSASFTLLSQWVTNYNGTVWTSSPGAAPLIAIRYSDGTIHPGMPALKTAILTTLLTAGSPNEIGNRFRPPVSVKVDAIAVLSRINTGGSGAVRLYDASGTVLADHELTPFDQLRDSPTTSAVGALLAPFATVDLSNDASYYVALRPRSTAGIYYSKLTFADEASRYSAMGDVWWSQRTGTGAWSEDTTAVAALSPRVSDYNIPIARSPRHPGMSGGMNG